MISIREDLSIDTNGAPATIEGTLPDYLLEGGKRPKVDATREYVAGGGEAFPLVGQLELSRAVDDLARDLGMQVYDVMLNDPTVSGALHVLITGILSGKFQVVPAIVAEDGEEIDPKSERGIDIETAHEAAQECRHSVKRIKPTVKALCYDLMLGFMAYGCRLGEKVYEEGSGDYAGKIVLKLIRVKRNQSWSFVVNPTGEVVAIRALCFDVGLHDLPPEKFMIASWMPRDADPRGRSILRAAYNGWNLKINGWPKYFKYLELFGSPLIVGIASADASDEPEVTDDGKKTGKMLTATEAMGQMLSRITNATYAALRNGSDVKFCQAAGEGQAFATFFDLTKREILEGILLSARAVMESSRNSQADADQATDVVGQILLFGREFLEDLFHRHLFHQLMELNHGPEFAQKFTPHCSLGEVEHQDIQKTAMAYAQLGYQIDPSQQPVIDAKLSLPVRKKVAPLPEKKPVDSEALKKQNSNPAGFQSEGEDDADPFARLRRHFSNLR